MVGTLKMVGIFVVVDDCSHYCRIKFCAVEVNRCLDSRLRWYHLNEYSPKNFDLTTPAHAMSSSESGSSAASQPVPPHKSTDSVVVETQNEGHRNSTQSPVVVRDLQPQTVESAAPLTSQQRSVEGGPPILPEPLDDAEREPGQNRRSSSRESLDMSSGHFEKDDDGQCERLLKERTNSELVGLLPERALAPEDQASNSRSNVSTPVTGLVSLYA